MQWEVEGTDEFAEWFDGLSKVERADVIVAVDRLSEYGPTLGRPFVDTLHTTLLPNLKELRPQASNIRILFVFDPRRSAILLFGGDKTGEWNAWYQQAIPRAVNLYEAYLDELREEGLIE
jgi:hypothetical protein